MKITGDYHTHTRYSHGKGTIKDNVQSALDKGLNEIAITDHGPRTHSIIKLGVDSSETFLDIKREIKQCQKLYPEIRILSGVEANIINKEGKLDVSKNVLKSLDLIAAGFHLLIIPPDLKSFKNIVFNNIFLYRLSKKNRDRIRQWNTEAVINAVKNNKIDFITHPGYGIDIDTRALAEVCSQENTLLEINSRHIDLEDNFVKKAAETRVNFIINSDAHTPGQVGNLQNGIKVAKKLNLNKKRVFNLN